MSDEEARDFTLSPKTRRLFVEGAPVAIGARAFDVLRFLETHTDRVVSKRELLEEVWSELTVEEGNLTVQISTLRKILGARAIATVPGVGYKLTRSDVAPQIEGSRPPLPDKPSLAVLPFANLTGSEAQSHLVDGLVTELVGALSRVAGLFVISSSSSFWLKGKPVDLADVGAALGVRYVLEGAIQQLGDTLRITVHLVEAETRHTLWSDRFSGERADLFELQDQISETVSGVIEPTLLLAEGNRAARKPTTSLAAYELCLRAMPLALRPSGPADFEEASSLLENAIATDSNFAVAKAWKCRAFLTARAARWIEKDETEKAVGPVASALLDEPHTDPHILAFAGFTAAYLDIDRDRAVRAVRYAVRAHPNSVLVLNAAGWCEHYVHEFDRSIEHMRRAVRLDPIGLIGAHSRQCWGLSEFHQGHFEAAVEVFEEAFAADTPNGGILMCLAATYWHLGRLDEARRLVPRILEAMPGFSRRKQVAEIAIAEPRIRARVFEAFTDLGLPD